MLHRHIPRAHGVEEKAAESWLTIECYSIKGMTGVSSLKEQCDTEGNWRNRCVKLGPEQRKSVRSSGRNEFTPF